jgi:hypothetical protein
MPFAILNTANSAHHRKLSRNILATRFVKILIWGELTFVSVTTILLRNIIVHRLRGNGEKESFNMRFAKPMVNRKQRRT